MTPPARVLAGLSLAGVLMGAPAQPAWDTPLAGVGDAARGSALLQQRQEGLCVLCHSGPFAAPLFQGNLGPSLAGVGARLSAGQLRLRLMDSRQVNPESIMPPYFETRGLQRVAKAYQGQTLMTAQQIEDVVAYLLTLQ